MFVNTTKFLSYTLITSLAAAPLFAQQPEKCTRKQHGKTAKSIALGLTTGFASGFGTAYCTKNKRSVYALLATAGTTVAANVGALKIAPQFNIKLQSKPFAVASSVGAVIGYLLATGRFPSCPLKKATKWVTSLFKPAGSALPSPDDENPVQPEVIDPETTGEETTAL